MHRIPKNLEREDSSDPEWQQTHCSENSDSSRALSEVSIDEKTGREYLPYHSKLVFTSPQGGMIRPFRCPSEDGQDDYAEGKIGMRVSHIKTRSTTNSSGIWAEKLYAYCQNPPSPNDPDAIVEIMNHLREVRVPSPWLSIWLTPLPAIHRLVNMEAAQIAFMNVDELHDNDLDHPMRHRAEGLIQNYQIRSIGFPDGRTYWYRGGSEYLVWQHIEKHAIVGTMSRAEFDSYLAQNPDLQKILSLDLLVGKPGTNGLQRLLDGRILCNARVGYAIGRFLKRVDIPRRFVNKFSSVFASNFKFRSRNKKSHQKRYLEAVWKGYKTFNRREVGLHKTPVSLRKEPLFSSELDESPCVRTKRTKNKKSKRLNNASNTGNLHSQPVLRDENLLTSKPSDFGLALQKRIAEEAPIPKIRSFATDIINNFSSPLSSVASPATPQTSLPSPTPLPSQPTTNLLGNIPQVAAFDDTEGLHEASVVFVGDHAREDADAMDIARDNDGSNVGSTFQDAEPDYDSPKTLVGEPSDIPDEADVVCLSAKRKFDQMDMATEHVQTFSMDNRRWIEDYLGYSPYRPEDNGDEQASWSTQHVIDGSGMRGTGE